MLTNKNEYLTVDRITFDYNRFFIYRHYGLELGSDSNEKGAHKILTQRK